MISNFSLFDILASFSYDLKYSNFQYAVFQKGNHFVYTFQYNDRIQFCDNDLSEGDKIILFGKISSTLPNNTQFVKHSYKVSITESISPDVLKTKILAVKNAESAPSNKFLKDILFESPTGEEKIILYRDGVVVNSITVHPDRSVTELNSSGSHTKLIDGTYEFIKLYTSVKFIDDYILNSYSEDPFIYVHNPSDIRFYPGIETYITSFKNPSIVPSTNFLNDIKLYIGLSGLYDPQFSLAFADVDKPSIIIKGSDRKELKKFTNKIQRKFLKLKNDLSNEHPGVIDLKGVEFYYYADSAFFPLPRNVVFQQYIFALIQEALKLPIQIIDIPSKSIENSLLQNTTKSEIITDENLI